MYDKSTRMITASSSLCEVSTLRDTFDKGGSPSEGSSNCPSSGWIEGPTNSSRIRSLGSSCHLILSLSLIYLFTSKFDCPKAISARFSGLDCSTTFSSPEIISFLLLTASSWAEL